MDMKKWREDVISSPKRLAIPIMTHPGIDMVGKNVRDAVTDGHVHAAAVIALAAHYPAAAATMMMDLSLEAEAFGAPVRFDDHEVPTVTGRIVESTESIEALKVPGLHASRVPQYLLAAREIARSVKHRPVFAGCIGPFSLAGRLFDMTEIMTGLLMEPDAIHELLDKCTRFLVSYAAALKKEGTNGLVIAEPAAGVLSPGDCLQFSSTYVKRIVDEVQDDSFMVILHNCGAREMLIPAMLFTGANGYHFGNVIDMMKPLEAIPPHLLVMGNLDPVRSMKMATPETLQASVIELLGRTKKHQNYVLSTGCDSPPGVRRENIEAFYEGLRIANTQ